MTAASVVGEEPDGRICINGAPPGEERGVTVLIDNYDSFTFNVVQYLVELGANLVVFRNDKVTVETLESLRPVNLVISPGPGHPLKDGGVSMDAVRHFAGRIPILGICMGLQVIVASYGGVVESAGEIVHGKVSPITHDGRGLYRGLPTDGVVATRYHSLAARATSMPDELVVTSSVASGVIMGVRHRVYTVEAVQYHPESVISNSGKALMRNFLTWRGGSWEANPEAGVAAPKTPAPGVAATDGRAGGAQTILQRIYAQRMLDVADAKARPGASLADLETSLALHLDPPQVDFAERLARGQRAGGAGAVALMAEMKRASPSKGNIDPDAHAGVQALAYARGGASVVSVLTEPHWFKGSLTDLTLARQAVAHLPERPAILLKDFVLDVYQIAQARLAGADTVLLIVAMLDDPTLRTLYEYSVRLGMEPLVEVNNAEEMARALQLRPKVIGVNNRNLHSFDVDMRTTSNLAQAALERGVLLAALSGIQGREDVARYAREGVHAVLVGEALMRATDKRAFIAELTQGVHGGAHAGANGATNGVAPPAPLVKVCGLRTVDAALEAVRSGAHMLGMILVPGTKRSVSLDEARQIAAAVRALPEREAAAPSATPGDWFGAHAHSLAARAARRPLLVGVFRDQPLDEVMHLASALQLDAVQLHGRMEPIEWARLLPGVYVIRVFHVDDCLRQEGALLHGRWRPGVRRVLDEATRPGYHHVIALDTAGTAASASGGDGGSGQAFDWSIARALTAYDAVTERLPSAPQVHVPFVLAGGLTAQNVAQAVRESGAWAVDTSSGVESGGAKDLGKIRAFLEAARR